MAFDLQPVLTGTRVRLRPLRAADFDALFAVASDPLIWEQHPDSDRYQEPVFRRFFADAMASGGALLAEDVATSQAIGSSRYHGYKPDASEIEVGWSFLARACWGGVVNGEMKQLMLDHAFRFVTNVVFLIGPTNWRSRKAVEKIGGVQIESRTNGVGRESVAYRIGRSEWGKRVRG